jgi:5-methylcytosine-specific restriction protein B
MSDSKGNRFLRYFPLLLDALRSTHPTPMRPSEARAWIRSHVEVPVEDLTRLIANKKQSIFENDVHWARFYLAKGSLILSPKRGFWGLTPEGVNTTLSPEETWALYVQVRDANRTVPPEDEESAPPEAEEEDGEAYWFVGSLWHGGNDQLSRFLSEGIWENGYSDQYSKFVRRMRAGDSIAIKSTSVRWKGLPFELGGKPASVMRIRATGTILENLNDGKRVRVAWDPPFDPRDWYFYTFVTPIVLADIESRDAEQLVEFAFHGGTQDYSWFLNQAYWAEKYGPEAASTGKFSAGTSAENDGGTEIEDDQPYTVDDIIIEGSFLAVDELQRIIDLWRSKKNLVLQGPPGTGKTWLAKRLGYAMVGSNDRETARSRLRVVQFHPSLAYEDFVRGWRPAGEGRLILQDGVFLQAIDGAKSEPDRPFVLVIEEINRGNPAQIFGELLTLLEDTKRRPSEAVELAYRKTGERVYVPANLYVVGTMNVADRSLAIVDLALRRRFAFVDLEPRLGEAWRTWCIKRGLNETTLSEIEARIAALNEEISQTSSLGPQFRIGHSYVTPDVDDVVEDGGSWFRAKVETEIGPLLDEYWYDAPERAKEARAKLLARLA